MTSQHQRKKSLHTTTVKHRTVSQTTIDLIVQIFMFSSLYKPDLLVSDHICEHP